MLYPYATFPGTLIVTCSQILHDKENPSQEKVLVNFEQPDNNGDFKEARYELPTYKEIWNEGFTPSETKRNLRILKNNEELIIECSKREGKEFA